ncbi:hypothetical protein VTK26DRAFT_1855 [Humicola hyalothermophila]
MQVSNFGRSPNANPPGTLPFCGIGVPLCGGNDWCTRTVCLVRGLGTRRLAPIFRPHTKQFPRPITTSPIRELKWSIRWLAGWTGHGSLAEWTSSRNLVPLDGEVITSIRTSTASRFKMAIFLIDPVAVQICNNHPSVTHLRVRCATSSGLSSSVGITCCEAGGRSHQAGMLGALGGVDDAAHSYTSPPNGALSTRHAVLARLHFENAVLMWGYSVPPARLGQGVPRVPNAANARVNQVQCVMVIFEMKACVTRRQLLTACKFTDPVMSCEDSI